MAIWYIFLFFKYVKHKGSCLGFMLFGCWSRWNRFKEIYCSEVHWYWCSICNWMEWHHWKWSRKKMDRSIFYQLGTYNDRWRCRCTCRNHFRLALGWQLWWLAGVWRWFNSCFLPDHSFKIRYKQRTITNGWFSTITKSFGYR